MPCIGVEKNLPGRGNFNPKPEEGRDQKQGGKHRQVDGFGDVEGHHHQSNRYRHVDGDQSYRESHGETGMMIIMMIVMMKKARMISLD